MNKYYYCYSPFLHEFLRGQGIRYITTTKSIKTGWGCWVYEKNDEFNSALDEYDLRKEARNLYI